MSWSFFKAAAARPSTSRWGKFQTEEIPPSQINNKQKQPSSQHILERFARMRKMYFCLAIRTKSPVDLVSSKQETPKTPYI
jgi:hypothetical protein